VEKSQFMEVVSNTGVVLLEPVGKKEQQPRQGFSGQIFKE